MELKWDFFLKASKILPEFKFEALRPSLANAFLMLPTINALIFCSSSNLTSALLGWTLTSNFSGSISMNILKTGNRFLAK